MSTPTLIRWQDPQLWPHIAAQIPSGHHVLTKRADANARFHRYLGASIRPATADTYSQLWHTAMNYGYQTNGLVLVSLAAITNLLGMSVTPGHDFGVWVQDNDLWRRVEGKIYPYGSASHIPGGRLLAYLVLGGECDHCATPRKYVRSLS
jgi:hypothetical protein